MSIIYNQADFLNKSLPTTDTGYEHMTALYLNISDYVNSNIDDVNNINKNMLKSLDETASIYKNANRSLGAITNSMADVFITGGGSRDSMNIFNKDIDIFSNGVIMDYDTMQIRLDRSPAVKYAAKKIEINTRNGTLGNTIDPKKAHFDINNIVSMLSRLEIESYESELDIDINIDTGNNQIFNNIKFNLFNFGTRLPVIGYISISEDGCNYKKVEISTSNSMSMDINDFDFDNGLINIHIKETAGRYLRLNLIQKLPYNTGATKRKRYAIGINALEVGFYSAVESGDIVIGPLKSKDEIFKVAAYSDMLRYDPVSSNIELNLSIDKETWIPFQNSSVFNPDSELSKIINFNNIDSSSLFTDEIVTEIYLKISMKSSDVSHTAPSYRNISRQIINASSSIKTFQIESVISEDYLELFRFTDIKYGTRFSLPNSSLNLNPSVSENISSVEVDGITMIQGLGVESDRIYDLEKDKFPGVPNSQSVIQFKYDKLHVVRNDSIENMPSADYDPFEIEMYAFSSVLREPTIIETINKEYEESNTLPVIPFKKNSGLYTLTYGDKTISISYNQGFFLDNREALYAVGDDIEEVIVRDELGRRIKKIQPFTIDEQNYISILDALEADMPTLVNINNSNQEEITWNSMYPLESLKENEYAIEFGKIVFSDYFKGKISYAKIMVSEIATEIDNSIDGIKLLSSSSKQIKTKYQLLDYDLEKTIKLKHTNLLEQSVEFDLSKSSINAFLKEVEFINGQEEFELTVSNIQVATIMKSDSGEDIILLHPDYIDSGPVDIRECNPLFERRVYSQDELIDMGDYFIEKNKEYNWGTNKKTMNSIVLPVDSAVSTSGEIEIKYNITPEKRSSAGFYSIDYINGVMHTASKIDGRTYISYKYSSVYAKYTSMSRINKRDYQVNGNNLILNMNNENITRYLLISSHTSKPTIEYLETPVLLDFNLNIVDARNSI
ncbi:MAG: hypothetical protein DRQ78_00830 [Epsilonproteobacteria bacterium]|nr:MAG: hypothetical protein DRQ78_00830 [Campylobacterota bacterium]